MNNGNNGNGIGIEHFTTQAQAYLARQLLKQYKAQHGRQYLNELYSYLMMTAQASDADATATALYALGYATAIGAVSAVIRKQGRASDYMERLRMDIINQQDDGQDVISTAIATLWQDAQAGTDSATAIKACYRAIWRYLYAQRQVNDSLRSVYVFDPDSTAMRLPMWQAQAGIASYHDAMTMIDIIDHMALNARQRHILQLLLQGLSQAQIAQRLGIDPGLVCRHVKRIRQAYTAYSASDN